jgi:hypothetical protein
MVFCLFSPVYKDYLGSKTFFVLVENLLFWSFMFFSVSGEYGKRLLANLHMRLNTACVFSEYVQILPALLEMIWYEASPKFIVFSMYDLNIFRTYFLRIRQKSKNTQKEIYIFINTRRI